MAERKDTSKKRGKTSSKAAPETPKTQKKKSVEEKVKEEISQEINKAEKSVQREMKPIEKEFSQEIKQAEKFVQEEVDPNDCCHIHDHKCKFGFACVAIILVAACAIGEYLFDHERYSELSQKSTSTMNSVQEDREQIKVLGQKLDAIDNKLTSLENKANGASINSGRKKWKLWVALKNKLESGESFDNELKLFNEMFSYDSELLQLVKETIGNIEIEPKESDGAVIETVKRYVNKVVTVRKIDHRKLLEISGYVITSIEGGLVNE